VTQKCDFFFAQDEINLAIAEGFAALRALNVLLTDPQVCQPTGIGLSSWGARMLLDACLMHQASSLASSEPPVEEDPEMQDEL